MALIAAKFFIDAVIRDAEKRLDKHLLIAAVKMTNEAKKLMKEPKSGTKKPKNQGKRGGIIRQQSTRSDAGEAPAVQTGNLVRSISFARMRQGVYRVGTNVKYGLFLEDLAEIGLFKAESFSNE